MGLGDITFGNATCSEHSAHARAKPKRRGCHKFCAARRPQVRPGSRAADRRPPENADVLPPTMIVFVASLLRLAAGVAVLLLVTKVVGPLRGNALAGCLIVAAAIVGVMLSKRMIVVS